MNREEAYKRLGVDPQAVAYQPQITPQLGMLAGFIRRIGKKSGSSVKLPTSPIYYLRASDAPEATKVLEVYYSLPQYLRPLLPIEAYAVAAGVGTLRLMEVITTSAIRLSNRTSSAMAAVSHPLVVEKTIEMALTDDGNAERNTLHRAVAFLPQPKGAQTNITIAQNATAQANAQAAAVPAPPPEATIRRMVNRFNDRTVPALTATTDTIRLPEVMPHEDLEAVVVESEETDDELLQRE
jgi:hypothetical protein